MFQAKAKVYLQCLNAFVLNSNYGATMTTGQQSAALSPKVLSRSVPQVNPEILALPELF